MTIPAELVAPVLIALTVVFSGWMVYEHRRVSADEAMTNDRLVKVAADDSARHLDVLSALGGQSEHLLARIVALEVPHSHETHTHELVKRSEHQEGGHLVIVKTCTSCDAVFRDKQA